MSNSSRTPGVVSARLSKEALDENFADLHPPFDAHEALVAADRCYFCHDAPCMTACPTTIDIPLFIRQIQAGNPDGAAKTIFNQNILGGMCARVCPTETLCEEVCVRETAEGKPVEIGRLQRYATDGLMAKGDHPYSRGEPTGKKIAVVGAGPAGLACAHRLAMKGHDVVIHEARPKPGGLNEYGIASYKTVDDFAQAEVDWLTRIGGISFVYDSGLGAGGGTLDQLCEDFDAVFLGIGLQGVNALTAEGIDKNNVQDAVSFISDLRQASDLSSLSVGRRVVVVGGGMTAVPTGAFKEVALRGFPAECTVATFRTSGTSSERRGELHLDTLELYEASLLANLRRNLIVEHVGDRLEMQFLAPPPTESPDSSLTHMFEVLRREEGSSSSRFLLRDGQIDDDALFASIDRARTENRPVLLAGTSFAFVHLLDTVGRGDFESSAGTDPRYRLPSGSRVMETGGFKGKSREVPRERLRSAIASTFGLDEASVVNQYGMTELGSQFYDSTLVDPDGQRRKLIPPWVEVRIVDPDSGREVTPGEVGLIVIHDLANTGSVAALQTADLGRFVLDRENDRLGFDVIGREEGAEARGCSIATDIMLDVAQSPAWRPAP